MDSALRRFFLWRLDEEIERGGIGLLLPGPDGWAWLRFRWKWEGLDG